MESHIEKAPSWGDVCRRLEMHKSTLNRAGISLLETPDLATLESFLSTKVKASGRWTAKQATAARRMLAEIRGESAGVPTVQTVERQPVARARRPAKAHSAKPTSLLDAPDGSARSVRARMIDEVRGREFLFSVMAFGLVCQMVHTGGFVFQNTPIEPYFLRVAMAVIFAFAVDCAALVLTIHKGTLAYLVGFALFHFLVNLHFHYTLSGESWRVADVLLSAVVAFSNFSYSDLFTSKNTAEQ